MTSEKTFYEYSNIPNIRLYFTLYFSSCFFLGWNDDGTSQSPHLQATTDTNTVDATIPFALTSFLIDDTLPLSTMKHFHSLWHQIAAALLFNFSFIHLVEELLFSLSLELATKLKER